VSNPATGAQKLIDIEDDKKLRPFMDKRISQEVEASSLGDEWKVSCPSATLNKKKQKPESDTYTLNTFLHFVSSGSRLFTRHSV
jgi:hypothetical protein